MQFSIFLLFKNNAKVGGKKWKYQSLDARVVVTRIFAGLKAMNHSLCVPNAMKSVI